MKVLRPILLVAAATLVGGSLAAVSAQSPSQVLHERIEAPSDQASRTTARIEAGVPVIGPEPQASQNPNAIASQNKLLPEPSTDQKVNPDNNEPVHGLGGFGADRQTEASLDYFTGADNTLRYTEVFNPSIVPFKRMSSLDTVRPDFTLSASSRALSDLKVGGAATSGYDLFWGSILVEIKPGVDVPIPSVAPDMRILSYESEPPTALVFSRDPSDNFYLRTEETGAAGRYRVVFLAEASPDYFAPTVPKRLRIRDIGADFLRPMPKEVQKLAKQALDELRIHKHMFVDEALDKLVYYFREFEAASPPPNSGNVYWDLYTSQAGVCRHRSFAFMITANALGIPTRYVTNEAHAWVEVWLPGADWMRIDLGGAASTLEVSNAGDKTLYRPRGEDPFKQPPNYSENYSRLEGDIEGLRPEQIAERQRPYDGGEGNGEGNGSFFGANMDRDGIEDQDGPLTGPGKGLPSVPEEELAGKVPTYIYIASASARGYRGENIKVTGRLLDEAGAGLGNLRVDLFLAPAGNNGNDALLVGRGVTDSLGQYEALVEIPATLTKQAYEVYASTPGNSVYQPAVSE